MITVMFRCGACGLDKVEVKVPPREANEGIVHWTDRAMERCGMVHMVRSPICAAKTLDLYIPVPPDGKGIGEAAIDRPMTTEEVQQWRDAVEKSKQ